MSSYLDDYGVADARREKLLKRGVAAVLVALVLGGIGWYLFRDYREEQQLKSFFALLAAGDYQNAYAMWSCTAQTPCPDYPYKNFLEDWEPSHTAADSVKFGTKLSCTAGIIQNVEIGDDQVWLWVNRSDGVLSYAPWKTCNPRFSTSMETP